MPEYHAHDITISQSAMSAYIAREADANRHSELIALACDRMVTQPYDDANDASGNGDSNINPNECC